jgi:hypothetical protein
MHGCRRFECNNSQAVSALVMASAGVRMYHSQWLQFKE